VICDISVFGCPVDRIAADQMRNYDLADVIGYQPGKKVL